MYFDSLHDLLAMNGHGVYVWSAYFIGFGVVFLLVLSPLLRHRRQIRALQNQWCEGGCTNQKTTRERK